MKLITRSGSVYTMLDPGNSSFAKVQIDDGHPSSAVFVGELRDGLVQDLIEGKRELVPAKSRNGRPALGFTGSTATLEACEPKIGMRILSGGTLNGQPFWSRYSTPIVRIEG